MAGLAPPECLIAGVFALIVAHLALWLKTGPAPVAQQMRAGFVQTAAVHVQKIIAGTATVAQLTKAAFVPTAALLGGNLWIQL